MMVWSYTLHFILLLEMHGVLTTQFNKFEFVIKMFNRSKIGVDYF